VTRRKSRRVSISQSQLNSSVCTIRDVAKAAGVSVATVSRIANRKETIIPIAEQTRLRVKKTMKELGYRENYLARNFRSQKSHILGVIIQDITDVFFNNIFAGIESACSEGGYFSVIFEAAQYPSGSRYYIELFEQRRLDGIILSGDVTFLNTEPETLSSMCEKIPTVSLVAKTSSLPVPLVSVDNITGARLMTEHLISLGHRRIAFFGGLDGLRMQGYRDALKQAGLDYENIITFGNEMTGNVIKKLEYFSQSVRQLMGRQDRPTAFFCANDTVAMAVIKALHELGISVPGQVSVAGFDDILFAKWLWPPLTTVRYPAVETGCEGAKMLLDLLNGKEPEQKDVLLKPELVIRRSTGPCNN